jgi:hypothetical protein
VPTNIGSSTSSPQTIYLLTKCPCQDCMLSLYHTPENQHPSARSQLAVSLRVIAQRHTALEDALSWRVEGNVAHISSIVKPSSLSSGWSSGVSMSSSKDCFAIPRDASRPAKLPYGPSKSRCAEVVIRRREVTGSEFNNWCDFGQIASENEVDLPGP